MFTGIIQGFGKLVEKRPSGGGMIFALEAAFDLVDPEEGESIAVNGTCLTARNIQGRKFYVDISPESLTRTNLGKLATGDVVNLERALRLSDRLGGHMVSGHIDALAEVVERRALGDFTLFTFSLPTSLTKYVIEKGSIAINGISLTVNQCWDDRFSVSIIPHTLEITTLGRVKKGDTVNIEVDIIGKYVEKLLAPKDAQSEVRSSLSRNFLSEHGFLR
ncbi:MAG: riboflavin synthase [Desulfobulbaceae bacterium]|nr:riboflavin synthase [Desulfobulbaceae bacterium]